MIRVTADASVCLKWFLAGSPNELDSENAISVLLAAREGRVLLMQPPHWRAEVAAVLARREPKLALECVADLLRVPGIRIVDSPTALLAASQIAVETGEHVFDALYHALAMECGATFITADERYLKRARALGSIALLRNYEVE